MRIPQGKKWLPYAQYLKSLPTKHIGTGMVLRDRRNRILLVKPIYRDYWKLPGGAVDPFESPSAGCVREVREELSYTARDLRLLGVTYNTNLPYQYEDLQFYFDGGVVSDTVLRKMKTDQNEIEAFQTYTRQAAMKVMRRGSHLLVPYWYAAIRTGRPFYLDRTISAKP